MKKFYELLMIVIGTTILALGVNWFLEPVGLVTGGLSGFSIVVKTVSENIIGYGIPLSVTTFVLNIPLFVIIFMQRGFNFMKKTLYGVVSLSLALWYTGYIPNIFNVNDDLFLCSIFGGAFVGAGLGLVLKVSATTGGTDTLASIIKFKFPYFPIQQLMLIIDGIIILSGFFIFGPKNGMYAILAVLVTSKVISVILEGMHYAKAAFIITDKTEEVAKEVMEKIPRGATGLKARGMYSKNDKEMLFVVVSQKQITQLRDLVKSIDEKAFITIADVREVLGEGFIEDYSEAI